MKCKSCIFKRKCKGHWRMHRALNLTWRHNTQCVTANTNSVWLTCSPLSANTWTMAPVVASAKDAADESKHIAATSPSVCGWCAGDHHKLRTKGLGSWAWRMRKTSWPARRNGHTSSFHYISHLPRPRPPFEFVCLNLKLHPRFYIYISCL